MRCKLFAAVAISMVLLTCFTGSMTARTGEMTYTEIPKALKYKNQIQISNVTETNKVHLGTLITLTCYLENTLRHQDGNLMLLTRFTDFSLDGMKRELQIEGNEVRDMGPRDISFMSHIFKRHLYDKWIQLTFTQDGTVLSRRHDEGLEEAEPVNFLRVADQFIIPLPNDEVQIGQRWEADYVATVALTEETQYIISKARYTYMGTVIEKGIPCHKISVNFSLTRDKEGDESVEPDRSLRKNTTSWTTYTGHGTIYLAAEGNYLVKSEIMTDLSFLMILDADEKGNFVNFIRSKTEQSMDLVTEAP